MKILVAGDFCDNLRISQKIKNGDFETLFGNVRELISSVDYSIVNFEFPVVLKKGIPIPKCGPNLYGQAKSVDAIKYAGFKCCTLANNHILDQGEQCGLDTKLLIEKAGLDTVGFGCNSIRAAEILYKNFDGKTLAIINCCEHEFSIAKEHSAGANALNPIQQYYSIQSAKRNADYVLVVVHGGHELFQLPSPRMKETYRFFIDAGADAVVNHHQHCYSGYEVYQNKPIFYGLGNFLFDKINKRGDIWNFGYMVSIEFKETISFELYPYSQCIENPSVLLMKDESTLSFMDSLCNLNKIIDSDSELLEKWENWVRENSKVYLSIFQTYSNRVLRALYTRNILPSFFTKSKKYEVLNRINCESHLDRLRFIVDDIK